MTSHKVAKLLGAFSILGAICTPIPIAAQMVVQMPVPNIPMETANRNLTAMARKPTQEQNWQIIIDEFAKIYEDTKDNQAAHTISILYKHRLRDQANAMIWLRRAAEGGLVDAKIKLAIELRKDKQSCVEALNWLNQMPDWHGEGHLEKAKYYEDGFCVPQDMPKARSNYELAAKTGDMRGQYRMGQLLALGIGGNRDLVNAYAWMFIARHTPNRYPELQNAPQELEAIKTALNGFPERILMRRVRQFCAIESRVCSLMSAEGIAKSGFKRGY